MFTVGASLVRPAAGTVAASAQVAVLLSLGPALGAAGWAAGLAYGLVLAFALRGRALGPADRVTLGRAVLAGGVTALAAASLTGPVPAALLVPLAAVALALDAVDGRVARRTGTSSAFGARFDMEVDAFLLVALGVLAAPLLGVWVLAIGAMRYVFGAARVLFPVLDGTLPPRYWRKVVAASQGVALLAVHLLPTPAAAALVATALALLLESFGRDTLLLFTQPTGASSSAGAGRRSSAITTAATTRSETPATPAATVSARSNPSLAAAP